MKLLYRVLILLGCGALIVWGGVSIQSYVDSVIVTRAYRFEIRAPGNATHYDLTYHENGDFGDYVSSNGIKEIPGESNEFHFTAGSYRHYSSDWSPAISVKFYCEISEGVLVSVDPSYSDCVELIFYEG